MGNPADWFIGRRGWLDCVRLGFVHRKREIVPSGTMSAEVPDPR